MAESRFLFFLRYVVISIFTLGIYHAYFTVTRLEEQTNLLREIRDELRKPNENPLVSSDY